jgi:hypothetical protein
MTVDTFTVRDLKGLSYLGLLTFVNMDVFLRLYTRTASGGHQTFDTAAWRFSSHEKRADALICTLKTTCTADFMNRWRLGST